MSLNERHEMEMRIRKDERNRVMKNVIIVILSVFVIGTFAVGIIRKQQCYSDYESSDKYTYTIESGDTLNSITTKLQERNPKFSGYSRNTVKSIIKEFNDNIIVNSYLKAGDTIQLPK